MPTPRSSRFRRIALILGLALSALVVVLLLAVGGLVVWLRNADLTQIAAREASEALGRQVTIGHLDVRWGDPLGIEITDLSVANAPWGSKADMIRIGRTIALLDVGALWRGELRYERLRLVDAAVVLERDENGTGNWKLPGQDEGGGSFAILPKDRTQFPTLIDFAGEDGLVTYRTRSGNVLRIELDRVAIASPGDDTPVRVQAAGAYNGIAVQIDATTESFGKLRDAGAPFGMPFTLAAKDTDIAFDGTAMEPLDFEGVRGRLVIEARSLNDILAALGSKTKIDLPLSVAGSLARDGDQWSLAAAKGKLAKTAFGGDLALLEGKAGAADDVSLDLDFAALDLDPLLAATGQGGAKSGGKGDAGWEQTPLYPDGLKTLKLSADLSTPMLSFGDTKLPDFVLKGRADAGKVALQELRFAFGGGSLALSGALEGSRKSARLNLNARLKKAEIGQISRLLGGSGSEIRGQLDGAATLALRGATLGEGLRQGKGAALLILARGDVARSLIEQVSADLRSIFREESGRVPVGCLLAALSLQDGIGTLAPLRLETDAAILQGAGTVDLTKNSLDLIVQTERDSTNFFALDLPIRISGPFARLAAVPQLGEDSGLPKDAGQAGALARMPASLREMAQGNPCAQ